MNRRIDTLNPKKKDNFLSIVDGATCLGHAIWSAKEVAATFVALAKNRTLSERGRENEKKRFVKTKHLYESETFCSKKI